MIPSRNLEDDIALRELRAFLGEPASDRRHLALACLSKLVPIQQVINDDERLELSLSVREELEKTFSQMLTYIDIVLQNR
tara:strand:- start:322 stop:561 length:240 start_codon:yes stop_codon:yes gene_type:complete